MDRVFNTRGFEFDWTRIDDALLRNLLGKGLAVPHETGFGIAADPATGEVAQRHGQRPGLYAVGHPLRGVSWESNAIGEQIAGATATVTALAEQLRGGNRLLPVGRNGPGPAGRQGRLTCSPSRR